ncbi:hypothetical protein CDD83_2601 [Cordyceps sp. RAO-2017]|nr:hypothetical protein CDD83_2601 [Cordyceps sp. RAO-2017]
MSKSELWSESENQRYRVVLMEEAALGGKREAAKDSSGAAPRSQLDDTISSTCETVMPVVNNRAGPQDGAYTAGSGVVNGRTRSRPSSSIRTCVWQRRGARRQGTLKRPRRPSPTRLAGPKERRGIPAMWPAETALCGRRNNARGGRSSAGHNLAMLKQKPARDKGREPTVVRAAPARGEASE